MRRKTILSRLGAAALALALLLLPAQALTVDQARELLESYYVDPVPQEVLDQPTIPAMLEALGDPYTNYLDAREYQYFLSTMADYTLGGIGVLTILSPGPLDQGLEIDEVLDDSPAQAAGLLAGDLIVAVDGADLAGLAAEEAAGLLAGEVGTDVVLTCLRQNYRYTRTLTRAVITIPATDGYLLEGDVGYIACDTWGEETTGHFRDLLDQMGGQAKCWLIDLRGNSGGLITAAVDSAGLFCGQDAVACLRQRGEGPGGYDYALCVAADDDPVTDRPVVLLVDGETASASELFTAILRDCGRAVVVGERTFGKGVSQAMLDQAALPDYFPDGDCLSLTFARVYSPMGNTNHIIGVLPHLPADPQEAPGLALETAQALAKAEYDLWPAVAATLVERYAARNHDLSDLDGQPYGDAIAHLAAYGLVRGEGDGAFHPEDTLTRAELAQMLANILDYAPQAEGGVFSDVDAAAWYAPAAEAMAELGFLDGVGEGRFAPDRVLTRQELFTAVGRLARWLNNDFNYVALTREDWQTELYALQDYDDWAKEPVWLLSRGLEDGEGGFLNALWDDPEFIDPRAPATRAEAAQVLYTLLSMLWILP